jgi:hypothetical protein
MSRQKKGVANDYVLYGTFLNHLQVPLTGGDISISSMALSNTVIQK